MTYRRSIILSPSYRTAALRRSASVRRKGRLFRSPVLLQNEDTDESYICRYSSIEFAWHEIMQHGVVRFRGSRERDIPMRGAINAKRKTAAENSGQLKFDL